MNEEVKGKMEDCHTDSELLTQFLDLRKSGKKRRFL